MFDVESRWSRRKSALNADASLTPIPSRPSRGATGGPSSTGRLSTPSGLRDRVRSSAFAFRGFDVENVGRTVEFLDHPTYGPTLRTMLDGASALCAEAIHRRVDLVEHIKAGPRSNLDFFAEDVATIVAVELAQLQILEECFGVSTHDARLSFGYSIGELAALVFGGVFTLEQLLPVPLALAPDCAELAHDLRMAVLFTRGPGLPMDEVERLCRGISSMGHGLIGPSAFLSPNTALILGQGDTIDRLDEAKGTLLSHKSHKVMLRRNANRWPPLHSPLVWQRSIPNRTAMALYHLGGGRQKPKPTILSCVTGKPSYDIEEIREVLTDWTDHPQRLWDVIDATLESGVETVIHVGPKPNLIPATFSRLAKNVSQHLGNRYMRMLGRGVVSGMNRNAWLSRVLPSKVSLLRAPYVAHVILEDWLLDQPVTTSVAFAEQRVSKN